MVTHTLIQHSGGTDRQIPVSFRPAWYTVSSKPARLSLETLSGGGGGEDESSRNNNKVLGLRFMGHLTSI